MPEHVLHAAIDQHAACQASSMAEVSMYAPTTPTAAFDTIGLQTMSARGSQDPWAKHHQTPTGYNEHDPAHRSMLFGHGHSSVTTPTTASMYNNLSGSVTDLALGMSSIADHSDYGTMPADYLQPTQVIVLSQLSPVGYPGVEQYSDHSASDLSNGFTSSFDSADVNMANYDMMRAPSPIGDYLGYPEGEEYAMEKRGCFASPTPETSSLKSRHSMRGSLPLRSKNRSSRRPRNKGPQRLRLSDSNGCDMVVEGEGAIKIYHEAFVTGKLHVPSEKSTSKPHKCDQLKPNGQPCTASFLRSEHLKRHAGSHETGRPWRCPMPACKLGSVQRPDNACDHYKTHLKKLQTAGVRNTRYEWPDMKQRLSDTLPPKQAEKTIRLIEKWIRETEEGKPQRHYL